MSNDTRQPAGAPTGGQFASTVHSETGTVLQVDAPAPTRPSQRSDAHTALHDRGLGEGKLSLLAPVEAQSVLSTLPAGADRPAARAHVDAYLHWRDLADTGNLHEYRATRIAAEASRQFEAARLGFADTQAALKTDRSAAAVERSDEAQCDLSDAVRRMDDANDDLRYLHDLTWRQPGAEPATESMNDYYARTGARRRFAQKEYRGQVF